MKDLNTEQIKLDDFQFIVLAPNSWVGQWMNRQHLFSRIGLYSNVVYSQGLPYAWELNGIGCVFSHPFSTFLQNNNVCVDRPSSFLVRWKKAPLIENIVMKVYSKVLDSKLSDYKQRVLYIFHPNYVDYIDYIKHDILVYHAYDDFSKQGPINSKIERNESSLVSSADLVITASTNITNVVKEKYLRSDVYTVENGVDFDAFSRATNSNNVSDPLIINHPRIGYIGSINQKVDIALLCHLVKKFSHANFVFVGPIGNLGDKANLFEELKNNKNVHLLGLKHYTELPDIAAAMDCHLLCYDTNPELWAVHAYPLKLNECLASKRPVISCDLPSVDNLDSIVDVAYTTSEWINHLNNVLEGNYDKLEAGYLYASKQDWAGRVSKIVELLCITAENLLTNKSVE